MFQIEVRKILMNSVLKIFSLLEFIDKITVLLYNPSHFNQKDTSWDVIVNKLDEQNLTS